MTSCERLAILIGALSFAGQAAVAGTMGATSSGTISISVTVPPHLQVINARERTSSPILSGRSHLLVLCAFANKPGMIYSITFLPTVETAVSGRSDSSAPLLFLSTTKSAAGPKVITPYKAAGLQASTIVNCADDREESLGLQFARQEAMGNSPAFPEPVTLLVAPD